MNIIFRCWQCGAAKPHKVDECKEPPQLGLELARTAEAAGYKTFHDSAHRRILFFCSDACAKKARKKNGEFRLRPLKEKT